MGRAAEAQRAVGLFGEMAIERWDVELVPVVRIGEQFGLTAHDAAYLWTAGRLRSPLATFDARVAKAAASYLKQLPPMS